MLLRRRQQQRAEGERAAAVARSVPDSARARTADGDGVNDGNDDYDHDGLSNQFEVRRPDDWLNDAWNGVASKDALPGANSWAYTHPFNPCKPFDSERCHEYIPLGYYDGDEVPPIGPTPPGGYPGSRPATPDG